MESQIKILRDLLEQGHGFSIQNFSNSDDSEYGGEDSAGWLAWKTRTRNVVSRFLSDDSPACRLVNEALKIQTKGNYLSEFDRAKSMLLKSLELALSAFEDDSYGELRGSKSEGGSPSLSNKIFVVHGHDQALKTDVERFFHEIGLEPIVLHRQPDQGQTIIEKFEANSDVGYAFILLTPDEIAYTVDQASKQDSERVKEKRPRPNVIFEFGYFVGKLGRQHVCCLYKGDVVLPSDLNGLVYKQVEDSVDSQAYSIIRELRAAGYKINLQNNLGTQPGG